MIEVIIDTENNAEDWWREARDRAIELPPVIRWYIDSIWPTEQAMLLSDNEAGYFQDWCKSLPGWNDGPPYAPTPLIFQRVIDVEEED